MAANMDLTQKRSDQRPAIASGREGTSAPDAPVAEAPAQEKLSATERAFAILEHVARSRRPLNMLDIVTALNLPKPTAYRLVSWFVSQGYLAREPVQKRIMVGSRLAGLAFGVLAASMRNSPCHVVLQRLVRAVNETCNVGTLLNGEIVYFDRVEASDWPLRLHFASGSRVPLHCTAMGKLLLALSPATQRRRIVEHLELRRFTESTIVERKQLEAELRLIRKEKAAFDRGEFLVGVVCVAVPIVRPDGDVLAAVALQAPQARMSVEAARGHIPALRRTADELAGIFQDLDLD